MFYLKIFVIIEVSMKNAAFIRADIGDMSELSDVFPAKGMK